MEWAEVPRAGRWLEEAGRNGDDGLTTYRMCLRWVTWSWGRSPYHNDGVVDNFLVINIPPLNINAF